MISTILLDLSINIGTFKSFGTDNSSMLKDWLPLVTVSITVFVTIFFFYKKYEIDKAKENEKEVQRIKDIRELFYVNFLRFKVGVNDQLGILVKTQMQLEKDIKNSDSTFQQFLYNYGSSPKQISEINRNDVFKFLVRNSKLDKKERIEIYTEIYGGLELLSVYREQSRFQLSQSIKAYTKACNEIDNCVVKMMDIVLDEFHKAYSAHGEAGLVKDKFILEVARINAEMKKTDNGTLDPIINGFIIPVHELSVNNVTHPIAQQFITYCKNSRRHYEKIFAAKRLDIEFCQHWNRNFSSTLIALRRLQELEFKDFDYDEESFPAKEPMRGDIILA